MGKLRHSPRPCGREVEELCLALKSVSSITPRVCALPEDSTAAEQVPSSLPQGAPRAGIQKAINLGTDGQPRCPLSRHFGQKLNVAMYPLWFHATLAPFTWPQPHPSNAAYPAPQLRSYTSPDSHPFPIFIAEFWEPAGLEKHLLIGRPSA